MLNLATFKAKEECQSVYITSSTGKGMGNEVHAMYNKGISPLTFVGMMQDVIQLRVDASFGLRLGVQLSCLMGSAVWAIQHSNQ